MLSFPKFGHWAVAWFALAPLLVAMHGVSAGRAARLGYVTGVVSSLGLLYWTALVVIQYGGLAFPVGVAVMLLLCLAVALFSGLFGWFVGRWLQAFGPVAVLLAPVAWVATEILRANTLCNFSWCLLGYSQHENLPMIQIASWGAVYAVSFLVASCSSVMAYLVLEKRPRLRTAASASLGAVFVLAWIQGARALSSPMPVAGEIRVGLVQADIRQDEKWRPDRASENLRRHLDLTVRAADLGARLVVWPESSVPFLYDRTPPLAAELQGLVRARRIYLLFGNDDLDEVPGGNDRVFVGAKMLTPAGELPFRYHKMRLVPFGEYVPLQPAITLGGRFSAKLVEQVADFTPGTEYAIGEVDGHRVAAFICYEAIFPDLVRQFTTRGADLLVNITNDAWYGWTSAPHQHLAMAAFRAVETGKFLVRAANTGFTAVVDPRGRMVARTRLFERTVLVQDVPIVQGSTIYSRHGDVFAWCCFGAAALLTVATARRRRRNRRES